MKTNSLWIVGGKIDFLAVKHSLIGGAFLFGLVYRNVGGMKSGG